MHGVRLPGLSCNKVGTRMLLDLPDARRTNHQAVSSLFSGDEVPLVAS